jgi:copper transport protein
MKIRTAAWMSLVALFASFLWAGVSPMAASAHALLVRSLPEADAVLSQSPAKIDLWFTEAFEPGFSRARLFNSDGQEVPAEAASQDPSDATHMTLPLGQLEPGVYTLAWQTLSKADGHEFSGSFPFTLLNPDGTRPGGGSVAAGDAPRGNLPSPGELLTRWLWLLGSMLLFGTALFQFIILPVRFPVSPHEAAPIEASAHNLGMIMIWTTVLAITVGQGLHLILQAVDLGGLYRLTDLLFGTRTGTLMLARQTVTLTILLVALKLPQPRLVGKHKRVVTIVIALLVALLAVLLMPITVQGGYLLTIPLLIIAYLGLGLFIWIRGEPAPLTRRRLRAFLFGLSGLLLLYVSLGSHADAGSGSFWAVLADFTHLLAAGAWVGGLVSLSALLWQIRRLPEADRTISHRPLLELVRRFSYLASFSVFVLSLTGLFNSLVQLPNISLLWQTTYGWVLILKLGLIALAMGIAFFNNRLVHGGENRRKASSTLRRLDRQVIVEVGVVLLLVVSVAVLVQTPTPRDAALANAAQVPALPFNTVVTSDDLSLHVQVTPNQVGKARFWVHVYHADGSAVGEIQLVQLRFTYRDVPLGQTKVDLAPLGGDEFAVEGAYLSQAGAWDLSAYVRRRDRDDSLARFSLDVPAARVKVITVDPWQNPIPAIPPFLLVICLIAALGVIPIVWRRPLQEAWSWYKFSWRGVFLFGFTGLIIGLVFLLGYGAVLNNTQVSGLPNPVDSVSYEQGKTLYEARCLSCHGPTGRGDGPAAAGMNPPPANFQVHLAGGAHSDTQLFGWISNGIADTDMPAFKAILSEDERWQIVNYIKSLVPSSSP